MYVGTPSQPTVEFGKSDEVARQTILEILARTYGASIAEVIDYHFDTRVAVSDPESYTHMIEGTFLGGAKHILRTMTAGLCAEFGVEHAEGMTLSECIDAVRTRLDDECIEVLSAGEELRPG